MDLVSMISYSAGGSALVSLIVVVFSCIIQKSKINKLSIEYARKHSTFGEYGAKVDFEGNTMKSGRDNNVEMSSRALKYQENNFK